MSFSIINTAGNSCGFIGSSSSAQSDPPFTEWLKNFKNEVVRGGLSKLDCARQILLQITSRAGSLSLADAEEGWDLVLDLIKKEKHLDYQGDLQAVALRAIYQCMTKINEFLLPEKECCLSKLHRAMCYGESPLLLPEHVVRLASSISWIGATLELSEVTEKEFFDDLLVFYAYWSQKEPHGPFDLAAYEKTKTQDLADRWLAVLSIFIERASSVSDQAELINNYLQYCKLADKDKPLAIVRCFIKAFNTHERSLEKIRGYLCETCNDVELFCEVLGLYMDDIESTDCPGFILTTVFDLLNSNKFPGIKMKLVARCLPGFIRYAEARNVNGLSVEWGHFNHYINLSGRAGDAAAFIQVVGRLFHVEEWWISQWVATHGEMSSPNTFMALQLFCLKRFLICSQYAALKESSDVPLRALKLLYGQRYPHRTSSTTGKIDQPRFFAGGELFALDPDLPVFDDVWRLFFAFNEMDQKDHVMSFEHLRALSPFAVSFNINRAWPDQLITALLQIQKNAARWKLFKRWTYFCALAHWGRMCELNDCDEFMRYAKSCMSAALLRMSLSLDGQKISVALFAVMNENRKDNSRRELQGVELEWFLSGADLASNNAERLMLYLNAVQGSYQVKPETLRGILQGALVKCPAKAHKIVLYMIDNLANCQISDADLEKAAVEGVDSAQSNFEDFTGLVSRVRNSIKVSVAFENYARNAGLICAQSFSEILEIMRDFGVSYRNCPALYLENLNKLMGMLASMTEIKCARADEVLSLFSANPTAEERIQAGTVLGQILAKIFQVDIKLCEDLSLSDFVQMFDAADDQHVDAEMFDQVEITMHNLIVNYFGVNSDFYARLGLLRVKSILNLFERVHKDLNKFYRNQVVRLPDIKRGESTLVYDNKSRRPFHYRPLKDGYMKAVHSCFNAITHPAIRQQAFAELKRSLQGRLFDMSNPNEEPLTARDDYLSYECRDDTLLIF